MVWPDAYNVDAAQSAGWGTCVHVNVTVAAPKPAVTSRQKRARVRSFLIAYLVDDGYHVGIAAGAVQIPGD